MKMNDLKKKILMKVRRMEYKHVNFPEEYIETEKKYKKSRDNLNNVNAAIVSLINFEHGGSTKKKIAHGLSVISSVSNLNMFTNLDVFESISNVCAGFTSENDKATDNTNKMAVAYKKISELKKKFNEKCMKEIEVLKDIKKKTEQINKEREAAKSYRYDLELAKDNESRENREEHDRYEELFDKSCIQALSLMNDFIGDDGIQGVLNRVLGYNIDFFRLSYEELQKAK